MGLKKLVVLLAVIVGVTWSQEISSLRTSRYKRDGAPSIVYGNVDTQAQNHFQIGPNAQLPPGSQAIGGSILTQEKNQYLTILDSGKLVIMMPDMIQLPDPLVFLGLNDSQVDTLLNVTHEQHNAQIIYNLKQSLSAFKSLCEKMAQTVDAHLLGNPMESEDEDGYSPNDYNERLWHNSLVLHRMKINRLERTLNRFIRKIKNGDAVTDSDVERAQNDATAVLTSHKKLATRMQRVLGG